MKNIQYYLERGFDQRTAEYFAAGRRTIVPAEDFTILLAFDNGERRRLDMKNNLEFPHAAKLFRFLNRVQYAEIFNGCFARRSCF